MLIYVSAEAIRLLKCWWTPSLLTTALFLTDWRVIRWTDVTPLLTDVLPGGDVRVGGGDCRHAGQRRRVSHHRRGRARPGGRAQHTLPDAQLRNVRLQRTVRLQSQSDTVHQQLCLGFRILIGMEQIVQNIYNDLMLAHWPISPKITEDKLAWRRCSYEDED